METLRRHYLWHYPTAFLVISPSIWATDPSMKIKELHSRHDIGLSDPHNLPARARDVEHSESSRYYNPQTSWKQCGVQENDKQWLMCLGSQGGAYSLCPIEDEFDLEFKSGTYYFWGSEISFQQCMHCPVHDPISGQDCATSVENMTQMFYLNAENASNLLDLCTNLCEGGLGGEFCSLDQPCSAASHFCDFHDEDLIAGTCQECPTDINDCFEAGFLDQETGRNDCLRCQLHCDDFGKSNLIVDGEEIPSDFMHLAIQEPSLSASGTIIDCSDLIRLGEDKCIGAQGKICYVEADTKNINYWDLSQKAEDSGCVALILNATYNDKSANACGFHSYDGLGIPFVCISSNDGKHIKAKSAGKLSTVEVHIFGQACQRDSRRGSICSENIPCTGEKEFCPFDKTLVDGDYKEGWCTSCPTEGNGNKSQLSCYFDFYRGYARDPKYVVDCVNSCNAEIEFRNCKFCPDGLNSFVFGVENEAEKCHFCPKQDIKYPDRLVPIFGDNITCWQMQEFYESVDIAKDSQNCALAHKMNFICGCEGTGYAGANTETKEAVLAWLPRVMAILSISGSSFILYDTTRTARKRDKLMNQMLSTLSFFDILGSIAYAFTTLPTPQADYLYGSKGNHHTCIVQGFFIQIGTIACFLNVSLSVYYLLTIKYGWKHEKLKRNRVYFFLPPIIVGLVFAFVGIPYYDNALLWCNNTSRYWPEIPTILAIVSVTFIMCIICYDVQKTSRASLKYSTRRNSNALSGMVFAQACWFTGAFYVTWIPYLAIQYMWSSGKGFVMYGFILCASSAVPLQGFWNFVVYVRPRYFSGPQARGSSIHRRLSVSSFRSSITRMSLGIRPDVEIPNEECDTATKVPDNKGANPSILDVEAERERLQ